MIVICEECGKRYRIDPAKIKAKQARFKCRRCNNVITVSKPVEETKQRISPEAAAEPAVPEKKDERRPSEPKEEKRKKEPLEKEEEAPREEKERAKISPVKARRLGIRGKMILLFFLIPLLLMAGASYMYIRQLDHLSSLMTEESRGVVNNLAEKVVAEKARSVAAQVGMYLSTRPGLEKTEFNEEPEFRDIGVQKVGRTGYTAVYELPGQDGIWRTWAHANPEIVGINMRNLRKSLGEHFSGFWRVFAGVEKGKESRGYYTWQDEDGRFRDKFMVCSPVEGTRFVVAATTYIDEFTAPAENLTRRAQALKAETMNLTLTILGATLAIIGLLIIFFSHRITSRINTLTDAAERISVGELETEVNVESNDEVGDLADAITRMQDSVRLAIERLRRRR